jgi:hypothetical protein
MGCAAALGEAFGLLPAMANQDATSVQVRHLQMHVSPCWFYNTGQRTRRPPTRRIPSRQDLRFAVRAKDHALGQLLGHGLL